MLSQDTFEDFVINLQIAWEIKALDNKKYIALSEHLNEVGRMLGGWNKQVRRENPALSGE